MDERLLQLYETICCWQMYRGYPITRRELVYACGLSSTSEVQRHLRHLRRLGLVTWRTGQARTLRLI